MTSVTMARPVSCAGAGQHLQAFEAVTLKCVGRAARLEGAAAKNAGAGVANMVSGGHQLRLGLNRARPSHGDEFVPADLKIEHRDNGLLARAALQDIRGFGKSFLPAFAHPALQSASDSGEASVYCDGAARRLHPRMETRDV